MLVLKTIIIGATSGIGKAVAVRLLKDGWSVGIAGRRLGALVEIASTCENAIPQQIDITDEDATAEFVTFKILSHDYEDGRWRVR